MLESIREGSQGLTAKIILGLVVLTFALAGVGSYTNIADTSAATVNGVKISQQDFERAFQNQRSRMQQQFGEMFDTLAADPTYMSNFRNSVLEQLINDELLAQQADQLALRISDEQVKNAIFAMPEFQVDGQFNNDRYLALINQAGFYQASAFRDYMRLEMAKRQLTNALIGSEFVLPYQQRLNEQLAKQTRDLKLPVFAIDDYKASVAVEQDEIESYYQANSMRFQTPEKVKVNYIMLDMAGLIEQITVSDEEVVAQFEANKTVYTQEKQVRAAHILVEAGDDEAAAEAKIAEIQARLNQGEDFAALAQTESDDTFSGENGGDLDWFGTGVMDPEFEQAAFALQNIGDVSDIVKSSFGFHLIKLLDVKAESIKPFDEVKDEIRANLKNDKAQDEFYELQQLLAERAFEAPDSLDAAASATGLTVQESSWLRRLGNSAPFNSPKVIDALFSDAVLLDNLNSDVIEVSPEIALVVHVKAHEPSVVKPLAEVQEEIIASLRADKAKTVAREQAEAYLAKLLTGEQDDSVEMSENEAVGRFGSTVDANVVKAAFKLAHPTDAVVADVVEMVNSDVAVVQVVKVNQAEIDESALAANSQAKNMQAQAVYQQFIEALKAEAEIVRRVGQSTAAE